MERVANKTAGPARWLVLAAYFSLYFIWGSTYLAIRFTVETIPPLFSGGARFLAAGAILLTIRLVRTKNFPSCRGWLLALRASLLPFVISYGLITTSELFLPSSIAALIIALEPLWFCLIGWILFGGAKPTNRQYAGIVAGFIGVCVLVAGDPNVEISFESSYTFWLIMVLMSSITWVIGAFISKDTNIHTDPLTSSGMQMLCGGAMMVLFQCAFSYITGDFPRFSAVSLRSVLSLFYLIIFGSLVAYTSFLWLMRVEPASRVSTHAFVNPIVAVLLGRLVGGEELHAGMLLSMPLVIISVMLMIWDKPSKN